MRYIAAVIINSEGRIEKYADFDTLDEASAHNKIYGNSGSAVLDNKTSVPIPHIKVVDYEITVSIPQSELDAKANEYKSKRAAEYPSIGDQLDALWKAHDGDSTEANALLISIKATKTKYPKPVKG